MDTASWLIVIAILVAPLLAIQAQKYLEILRERRYRKLNIFHALMATRAARLSQSHVKSLNMIDIEFYGKKFLGTRKQSKSEKEVIEAWKEYHDHLNTEYKEEEFNSWVNKGDDLFVELLHKMSKLLGYDYDKVQLRRGIYAPRGHSDAEIALLTIRDQLVKILTGKQPLPMEIISPKTDTEQKQKLEALLTGLIEYLDGKRTVKVKIDAD